ncbi:fatty acyl-AMP ligase [Mycolicibacter longobardus]
MPAFIFCPEGDIEESRVTYRELDRRARSIAARLQSQGAAGERVLVLCRPGIDSIAGLFGCFYAGAVAVPVDEHWAARRVETVVPEAHARFALATTKTQAKLQAAVDELAEGPGLTWLLMDDSQGDPAAWVPPEIDGDTVAMIQYTSGSTGVPKGCVLTHRNYLHNLQGILQAWDPQSDDPVFDSAISGVSWLPQYHDMGFVGGILGTLYGGGTTVLMSPSAFMMRPIRWLQAISRSRAGISAGPNFAYDACVKRTTAEQVAELDLSHWSEAIIGGGPISAATLQAFSEKFAPAGFRAEAFRPAYGLAEATLGVSGMSDSAVPVIRHIDRTALGEDRVVEAAIDASENMAADSVVTLVGCGSRQGGQDVLIVDPETRLRCGPDEVGEIWVAGPSVAVGYWERPEETEHAFHARLADPGQESSGPYLRTGDLGFFRADELFITGRCKDLMTIGGCSHYPNDIEMTVQDCHPALLPGRGAAFQLPTKRHAPEYLVVVQEVHRHEAAGVDPNDLIEAIRTAVRTNHGIDAQAVMLLKPMRIPTTTSGKIQRSACRDQYVAGELVALAHWQEPMAPDDTPDVKGALLSGLMQLAATGLAKRLRESKGLQG